MPPFYGDIGKANKDLLSGSAKSGAFTYDSKLTFASATSSGVKFAVSAAQKGDLINPALKIAYGTKAYSGNVSCTPGGNLTVNATLIDFGAPGLCLSSSVPLSKPSDAKVGLNYHFPYLAVKAQLAQLTSTDSQLLDLSATTGYKNFVVGIETSCNTSKSVMTKYNIGAGYQGSDFQVAGFLADKCSTARFMYAHTVDATHSVGAEVVRNLSTNENTFSIGVAKKLPEGSLLKLKLESGGTVSAMYEAKLANGEKVAGSLQAHASDLAKPLKFGFAIDLA
eukprot:gene15271-21353_t